MRRNRSFAVLSLMFFAVSILLIVLAFSGVGGLAEDLNETDFHPTVVLGGGVVVLGSVLMLIFSVGCSLLSDLFAVLALFFGRKAYRIVALGLLILNVILIFPISLLIRLL